MRRFLTAPYWVHLLVDTAISQVIWWGVTQIFETPIIVRSIIAGIILIAAMFCVAWYLPRLAIQSNSDKVNSNQNNVLASNQKKKVPIRLKHDNVVWEDIGWDGHGGIRVAGPYCPKDLSTLGFEQYGKVDNNLRWDITIAPPDGFLPYAGLICPKCHERYYFGEEPKTVQESEDEVRSIFEGMRRSKK